MDTMLIRAITNYGLSLPGLIAALVRKLLSHSIATPKGYMDQAQHGRHSTRPSLLSNTNTAEDLYPNAVPRSSPGAKAFVSPSICYSDPTGKFPVFGVSCSRYILDISCLN